MGQGFEHFITVSGNKLMDGEREFRFISWNIPNLNYVEDEMGFTRTNPYGFPTEFEMRDAFETVRQMGGQVIRIYTIPVRNKNFPPDAPTYVEAPGKFNEDAFKVNDRMLALANEYGIRIIFSLLNNWEWLGGRPNYADFRGLPSKKFWRNAQLKEDFKQTIAFTLNRVNTLTGIPYKDDRAILCWETGNELQCPPGWTAEMAKYIKELDSNHLVLDGYFAINILPVRKKSLRNPHIDMVSSHHYENTGAAMARNIVRNVKWIKGRKPYLVGEFGFLSAQDMTIVMDTILHYKDICGGLAWSLRYHHREGGFYWHSEPAGGGLYKAYHWPGFASGDAYQERELMPLIRKKAYEIQGIQPPGLPVPLAPVLLPIPSTKDIRWQGSTGATHYRIERALSEQGPWTLIADKVDETESQYFPLFHDDKAETGQSYFYRVFAVSPAGISPASNSMGPVAVSKKYLVDDMKDLFRLHEAKGVQTGSGGDRTYKEKIYRLSGESGSVAGYRVKGKMIEAGIYSVEKKAEDHVLILETSLDGINWRESRPLVSVYTGGEKNYDYLHPKVYELKALEEASFLRIKWRGNAQILRVEIAHQ